MSGRQGFHGPKGEKGERGSVGRPGEEGDYGDFGDPVCGNFCFKSVASAINKLTVRLCRVCLERTSKDRRATWEKEVGQRLRQAFQTDFRFEMA